jgi:hypothetical protein
MIYNSTTTEATGNKLKFEILTILEFFNVVVATYTMIKALLFKISRSFYQTIYQLVLLTKVGSVTYTIAQSRSNYLSTNEICDEFLN